MSSRARVPAGFVALACVASGCAGGSRSTSATSSHAGSVPSSAAAASAAPASRPPTGVLSLASGRGGDTPSTGSPASSGPAPVTAGQETASTASAAAPGGAGAPEPATPGTYTYRQSGSSTFGTTTEAVPAQGTMVVDPATGAASAQTWHRYEDTSQSPNDTDLAFATDGIFITKEVERVSLSGQSTTITCSFPSPGIPAPPWPPAVGKSFSVTGSCGSFSATVSGRITGQTTDDIGGQSVPVYVLVSTLVTRGQVELTATETDWLAVGFRLPLHTQTQSHGTYGIASFSSNTTADLESMTPK